jgi:hypothetical protein
LILSPQGRGEGEGEFSEQGYFFARKALA